MGVVTVKKMGGKSEGITVGDDMSVADLKAQVATVFQVPQEQQKLLLKGKPLTEAKKLKDYGVIGGATVTLVVLKPKKKGAGGAASKLSRGQSTPPSVTPPSGDGTTGDEGLIRSSTAAPEVAPRAAHAAAKAIQQENAARGSLKAAQGALAAAGGVTAPSADEGGGAVELELATMLEALEKQLGGPMAQLFAAVGGEADTSTAHSLQESATAMTETSNAIASLLTTS